MKLLGNNMTHFILQGVVISTVCALSLIGCSENPLSSLKKDQPSLKYTESFWNNEYKTNSLLWQQAIKICNLESYRATPNCGSIHDIQMFATPKPYPKYGTGQGFGADNMPTLKR